MLRKIWITAKSEYTDFIFSKKSILLLFSLIFLMEDVVGKMKDLAAETGVVIGKLEPFLLIFAYPAHAMIIPLMFVVVLSDFPSNKTSGVFKMVRTGRIPWLLGEILYALMMGLTYILSLLVCSILWMGKTGTFMSTWSDYMTVFDQMFPEQYMYNTNLFIGAGTVTQGSPIRVITQSVLLMMCCLLLIALLLAMCKLLGKKIYGLFLTIVLIGIGAVGCTYFGDAKWIFPMAHTIFGQHFLEFFAKPECPLYASYIYFLALCAVILVIDIVLVKKIRIGDDKE